MDLALDNLKKKNAENTIFLDKWYSECVWFFMMLLQYDSDNLPYKKIIAFDVLKFNFEL